MIQPNKHKWFTFTVRTSNGTRKELKVFARTLAEARKFARILAKGRKGILA